MNLLVKASYDTVSKFNGVRVKTEYNKKKCQVYFKLYCDDTNIDDCLELYRMNSNIVSLDYQGSMVALNGKDLDGVYITKGFDLGMNVTEFDVQAVLEEIVDGLTAVIKLPNEYTDMRFICEMCQKYENVRFTGGYFFDFEDARLGYIGNDILKECKIKTENKLIYDGIECALVTVTEEDVVMEAGAVATSRAKSSTTQKKPKKTLLFRDLLYQNGKVEF